jgi:hypothetical protein
MASGSDRALTSCGRRLGAKGAERAVGYELWLLVHDELPGPWNELQLECVGSGGLLANRSGRSNRVPRSDHQDDPDDHDDHDDQAEGYAAIPRRPSDPARIPLRVSFPAAPYLYPPATGAT